MNSAQREENPRAQRRLPQAPVEIDLNLPASRMDSKGAQSGTRTPRTTAYPSLRAVVLTILIAALSLYLLFSRYFDVEIAVKPRGSVGISIAASNQVPDTRCKPHLPSQLTVIRPPSPANPAFRKPAYILDRIAKARVSKGDIDSLVLGVIGPDGLVWQGGYGVAKANDTHATSPPNEHSIYRIASISKLFATLETFILRDRGALNWDDPVTRFYPNFTYKPYGWRENRGAHAQAAHGQTVRHSSRLEPITLRQLASHMSGIGRDYPSVELHGWPRIPPPPFRSPRLTTQEAVYPNKSQIFRAIAENPLVAPQYSFPIYSNTGFSLLGWCNSMADQAMTGVPITYAELVARDIFQPLGMNGSSFLLSEHDALHMAFPKDGSEADHDMTDSHNPAGGQMSSLSDIAKAVQSLLNPDHPNALLSRYSLREWFRPLHVFPDHLTQVGLAWEILKVYDSHGRSQHYYSKAGNLQYYHSEVSINHELGFGVVALMAGRYSDASWFTKHAITLFQPAFESLLEATSTSRYSGRWRSKGKYGENKITLTVRDGSLLAVECVLEGTDLIELYSGGLPMAIWSTERLDEFRVGIGRPALNSDPTMGCTPYWGSIDVADALEAPVDLLYFEESDGLLELKVPSTNATLRRTHM